MRVSGTAPNAANIKTTELASWSSAAGELFSNAAFAPDGKLIAFSSTRSGTKNIWVTQGTSSEPIQVTNDAFSNKDPIWSPKGDEIAYFSEKGNVSDGRTNSTGVWRVSALGGTPRSVGAISDGSAELRRWTASGKIYFESAGNLHALDINSGLSERVTALDPELGKVDSITISADENSIAYIRIKDGTWQLFTSDLANSRPSRIADGTGDVGGFAWLPDKNRFFLSLMVDGVFQVFVIEGSGRPVRITSTESDSIVLDPSPDGTSIIVSSAKEESDIWRVMVADSAESPVSRSVNAELWPAVSPDSTRIVFQSAKNLSRGNKLFETALMVKSLASRDDSPTQLAEKGFLATWSPDGSAIAFLQKHVDGPELWVANPNGGGERKLASGGIPMIGYSVSPYNYTEAKAFSWSPDSSKIAYVSNRSGAASIWAVSARDGSDAALTTDLGADHSVYSPAWSSDGKRLAFLSQKLTPDANGKNRKKLNIIDVASGNNSVVFETDKITRFLGWTDDENGLIIAETERTSGLPPEIALKRIAIGTGEETSIDRLKNAYYYNIVLSADRKLLAFAARNDDIDDIWVVSSRGGGLKKLTSNNDSALYFSRLAWLPDGSAVVFGKQTRFSLLSIITGIE
ncbi:MAG: PD40 domain-containing protein [Chloracidobacterium sp.]|nr:PD40 domain-containing protein [Chloracidobacterium sp.]